MKTKRRKNVVILSGADGPTSIFLAGKSRKLPLIEWFKDWQNQRKRILSLIAVVTAVIQLLVPVHASANVIFEPDNGFYRRHSEECEYLNRACYPGEDTWLWAAPNLAVTEKLDEEQEKEVYISFVYTDKEGIQWGYADLENRWILMADLFLKYSSTEFWKDHEKEIDTDKVYTIPKNTHFVLWSYPESGMIIDEDVNLLADKEITAFYQDSTGRTWGNIAYIYGIYDVWVCLSDMNMKQSRTQDSQERLPAQTLDLDQISELKMKGKITLGVLMVVAAVIVTAVILIGWKLLKWRKKKV